MGSGKTRALAPIGLFPESFKAKFVTQPPCSNVIDAQLSQALRTRGWKARAPAAPAAKAGLTVDDEKKAPELDDLGGTEI